MSEAIIVKADEDLLAGRRHSLFAKEAAYKSTGSDISRWEEQYLSAHTSPADCGSLGRLECEMHEGCLLSVPLRAENCTGEPEIRVLFKRYATGLCVAGTPIFFPP